MTECIFNTLVFLFYFWGYKQTKNVEFLKKFKKNATKFKMFVIWRLFWPIGYPWNVQHMFEESWRTRVNENDLYWKVILIKGWKLL